jgi:hypothetical protein
MASSPRSSDGQKRAWTTLALLALVKRGTIYDNDGQATRALQARAAHLTLAVTCDGMSRALNYLQQEQLIIVEVVGNRTYSIQLAGTLTAASVEALKRDEDWARDHVHKRTYTGQPIGAPPTIRLEGSETNETRPADQQAVPSDHTSNEALHTRLVLVEHTMDDILAQLKRIGEQVASPAATIPRPTAAEALRNGAQPTRTGG